MLKLRDDFATSFEMTARRVVELNDYACAVVFSKDNIVRYSIRSEYFTEWLSVRKGDRLPAQSPSRNSISDQEEWHEIEAHWGSRRRKVAFVSPRQWGLMPVRPLPW